MAISPQRLTIYLYSAHRAVIFATAQLSCKVNAWCCLCAKAETELIGLTKRVRGLEEDFELTDSRLQNTSTKLEEASKASDENER